MLLANLADYLQNLNLENEFYVYVPGNNKPRYIHHSYKSAKQEAERLQNKLPSGEIIEILHIKERFKGTDIPF